MTNYKSPIEDPRRAAAMRCFVASRLGSEVDVPDTFITKE